MSNFYKKKKYLIFSLLSLILGVILLTISIYKILYIHEYDIIRIIDFIKIKNNYIYPYSINRTNFVRQIYNRPWAALYTSLLYFFSISLGSFIFLIIQHISKSVWPVILIFIMEGVVNFIPYVSKLIFFIYILNIIGINNLFKKDIICDSIFNIKYYENFVNFFNKKYICNIILKLIKLYIFIYIINLFVNKILMSSKKLDKFNKIKYYNRIYKYSVIFIIIYSIYSIFRGWDWVMIFNFNWISTIFNWYLLGTNLCVGVAMITLLFLVFKSKLTFLSKEHLHDLKKYIFSTSFLWSYLWFVQFLLIWYSNIPEEVIYLTNRFNKYKNLEILILIINFVIPFFTFLSKKKRIMFLCISLLVGHYMNMYNMIMPESVGVFSEIGFEEIGSLIFIGSIFLIKVIKYIERRDYRKKRL
ncbi:hypothetical protein [Candidatus Karelsulcia muelleri]|uniref:Uncharacterized protein n=1 Tax=Candidatus Karelsulcia muelleri TaxID=336810 RepID=A0A3A1MKR2_9FLAO|nr:hypothetical protein [Candidatus Karelsulcia muelleri]RIU86197.1 hypothetical protein D2A33_00345 [Candidatus Karelsulcia muelleri]